MAKKRNKRPKRRARVVVPVREDLIVPEPAPVANAALPPKVRVFSYDADFAREHTPANAAELAALRGRGKLWVDIESVGQDPALFVALGEIFELHPLALEDVLHVHQRPKTEDYDAYAYIVVRMPGEQADELDLEQVSLFLGPDYVITIGERPGDCLDGVRERLRQRRGRLCRAGADYLAYSIIDAIVDSYSPIVERYNDRLEQLEADILGQARQDQIEDLLAIRHDLFALRRLLVPTREAIGALARGEAGSVSDDTRLFFRDCHDHADQLLDAVDGCREVGRGLMELHMYGAGNRLSEVMKVLTLVGSIFIPLHFIAGVYGMNFDRGSSPWNMPELGWTYGYPFALGLMLATASGLLLYFRRLGWLGGSVSTSGLRRPPEP